jgi:DNA-binding MarR family transcriptional regulator
MTRDAPVPLPAADPPASPRWLDADEMRAWRSFAETIDDLGALLDADLQPTGLSLGDYQVLVYLSEARDRRMRMCDLASSLQLSPSGLTRRLDGLVKAGLVSREGSRCDRRVMLAVLTADGMRALEAAAPVHVESVRRRIFDHLDRSQVDAMAGIFTAIQQALGASCPSATHA